MPIAVTISVVTCVALLGCSFNHETSTTTVSAASTANETGAERRAAHYRRKAMRETEDLAKRVCAHVPPHVLARSLGGADFSTTDTSPNAIALGYARDVDISPIPLQRAAAEGCAAGVRIQRP